jgi:hypothetical protein
VHGVGPLDGEVEVAGRTDAAIMRDLVALAGVGADAFDVRWPQVTEAAVAAYQRLAPPDLADRVAPGVDELLAALAARADEFRLSLVTGTSSRSRGSSSTAPASAATSSPARAASAPTTPRAPSCRRSPAPAPATGRGSGPS